MGYEVVYGRVFIKAGNMYIPLILSGSSNSTTIVNGHEVPKRSWWAFAPGAGTENIPLYSEDELFATIGRTFPKNGGEYFRYRSGWANHDTISRMCRAGVQKAIPLEDILAQYPAQKLLCQVVYPERKKSIHILTNSSCKTSEELLRWINDAQDFASALPAEAQRGLRYQIGFLVPEPLCLSSAKVSTESVIVKVNSAYVVAVNDSKSYHSYTVSPNILTATVFDNENEARQKLNRFWSPDFQCIDAKEKNAKPFVLQIKEGAYDRFFIGKLTSSKLIYCKTAESAKRFNSEKEAMEWYRDHIEGHFAGMGNANSVSIIKEE